jgi:hypothetical protein
LSRFSGGCRWLQLHLILLLLLLLLFWEHSVEFLACCKDDLKLVVMANHDNNERVYGSCRSMQATASCFLPL